MYVCLCVCVVCVLCAYVWCGVCTKTVGLSFGTEEGEEGREEEEEDYCELVGALSPVNR